MDGAGTRAGFVIWRMPWQGMMRQKTMRDDGNGDDDAIEDDSEEFDEDDEDYSDDDDMSDGEDDENVSFNCYIINSVFGIKIC